MFHLVIAVMAIIMVLVLSFATVISAAPDKLPEFIALFVGLIILSSIFSFCQKKYNARKYKKVVELKKKKIKMLRNDEIKNYVVDALVKHEFDASHVRELLSVLTIGKIKKAELEKEIIEAYRKTLGYEKTEIVTTSNNH
jgi:uncharacterized membrane-anchored protein YitT (DUF2179 family)